ncbi:GTPase HflX [Saliphagus sp. LR7]|uniref:GTPase HflX n=1 Tax=Saliphagus sp. LR7 TaxID=2282654 RepID=UPI000DF7BFF8|nr:GTPase HflX [Saliphagus sp. LR7]
MQETRTESTAVIAARSTDPPVETTEIEDLAAARGYDVAAAVTQAGPEDSGTYLGRGKCEKLAAAVAETGASLVVADGDLTPSQHHGLRAELPDGTELFDRYRLVLAIFERGAGTRRARLQVELARLRYELPRIVESADEGMLNKRTEKGSPVYDVRDRIDRLEAKLDSLPDPAEEFRRRRREEGFDLVTIAGYTNAGKSTLLHRLADDLSIDEATDGEREGPNKDATASAADRLFETLETTTRRATVGGRPVLATDTVGFVSDLPHWLVSSFSETLSEAAAADAVVLVADASDPPEVFREKLEISLELLADQGVDREDVVTACNKTDLLPAGERERRLAIAAERAPEAVATSAREGTGLDRLRSVVGDRLPTEEARLGMPNCDEAMSIVSQAYDRTTVENVAYDGDRVTVVCRGPPTVIERLRARADAIDG